MIRSEIVDCEMLGQGESSSEVLRRHIEFARSEAGSGATLGQAIEEMQELNYKRRYAEALRHWQRLDPSIRERKPLMSLRAFCAARVNGEALDEAVRDYRRLFPDDPAADLVTNEVLRRTDRNDEFLEAIDRIRSAVGEDPYLDVLSCWGLEAAGRLAEARDRVDAAVAAEHRRLAARNSTPNESTSRSTGFYPVDIRLETVSETSYSDFGRLRPPTRATRPPCGRGRGSRSVAMTLSERRP